MTYAKGASMNGAARACMLSEFDSLSDLHAFLMFCAAGCCIGLENLEI